MSCLSKQYLSLGVILVLLLPWKIQPSCHVVIFEHANCDFVTNLPKSVTKSQFLPTSLSSHSKMYQREMIILLILHFQRAIRVWQNYCKLLQDYQLTSFRFVPILPFYCVPKLFWTFARLSACEFSCRANFAFPQPDWPQSWDELPNLHSLNFSNISKHFRTHFKVSSNISGYLQAFCAKFQNVSKHLWHITKCPQTFHVISLRILWHISNICDT